MDALNSESVRIKLKSPMATIKSCLIRGRSLHGRAKNAKKMVPSGIGPGTSSDYFLIPQMEGLPLSHTTAPYDHA